LTCRFSKTQQERVIMIAVEPRRRRAHRLLLFSYTAAFAVYFCLSRLFSYYSIASAFLVCHEFCLSL
jgi:hypothetical protein